MADTVIHIDASMYKVSASQMTGAQIRGVPPTPIGPDRDLYLEVPGPSDDVKVQDDQLVPLRNGIRFRTSPHTFTAGSD